MSSPVWFDFNQFSKVVLEPEGWPLPFKGSKAHCDSWSGSIVVKEPG